MGWRFHPHPHLHIIPTDKHHRHLYTHMILHMTILPHTHLQKIPPGAHHTPLHPCKIIHMKIITCRPFTHTRKHSTKETVTTYKITQPTSHFTQKWRVRKMYQTIHGVQSSIWVLSNSGHQDVPLLYRSTKILCFWTQLARKRNLHSEKVAYLIYYQWIWFIIFSCGSSDSNIEKNSMQFCCNSTAPPIMSCALMQTRLGKVHSPLGIWIYLSLTNMNGPTYLPTVGGRSTNSSSMKTAEK